MKKWFTYPYGARLRGALRAGWRSKAFIGKPLLLTNRFVHWGRGVGVWKNCRIEGVSQYEGVRFAPEIILGDHVSIQQNLHLTCAQHIEIGENTAVAANVTITDIDHPYQDVSLPIEKQPIAVAPVKIGRDCKIYNNAVILPGTTIGNHCVVGAGSVVKGDFPSFCVIVGAPARAIKQYNFETKVWEKV